MFTTGMLLWWTKVDFNLIAAPWFWAPALHKERSLIHQSVLRRRLPPSCLSHSASQFGTFQKSAPEEEVRYPLNNRLYPKRHQQPLSAPFHQCFFALLCLEITVWQFVWRTSLWYFLSKCHKGCYQKKRYKAFKPLKGATCLTTVFFICKHKKVFSSLTKISRRRTLTKGSFASFAKNSSKPRGGGIVLNLPGGEGQSGALSNFSWQKSERKWKANPQTIES